MALEPKEKRLFAGHVWTLDPHMSSEDGTVLFYERGEHHITLKQEMAWTDHPFVEAELCLRLPRGQVTANANTVRGTPWVHFEGGPAGDVREALNRLTAVYRGFKESLP